ncbi:MAG: LicD family protein [Ruminococcaceae bacterium]|nr:LicD family protein [Oscillospiraceae bacterium]
MNILKEHQAILFELLTEFDRVCKKHNIPYVLMCGSALGAVRHKGIIPWDDDLDVSMLRSDYEHFLKVAPADLKEQYYLQAEGSAHWTMNFSKLRKNNTTYLEKFHPKDKKMHQGIYIDIFPCDNASDKEWIRKLQFYASRVALAKSLWKRGYETDSNKKKIFMACCCLLPAKPFLKLAMQKKKTKSEYVQTFLACTSRYRKGIYKRSWFTETIEMDFENMKVPISAHYDELLTVLYGDYMKLPSEEEKKIKEHAILIDTERDYSEYENYRDGMKFEIYTRNIH